MDTVKNVADWISNATVPSARTVPTLDVGGSGWTIELEYLSGSAAARSLEQLLGPADFRIPGFVRRWSFAGTTVVQRGRRVAVIGAN